MVKHDTTVTACLHQSAHHHDAHLHSSPRHPSSATPYTARTCRGGRRLEAPASPSTARPRSARRCTRFRAGTCPRTRTYKSSAGSSCSLPERSYRWRTAIHNPIIAKIICARSGRGGGSCNWSGRLRLTIACSGARVHRNARELTILRIRATEEPTPSLNTLRSAAADRHRRSDPRCA